MPLDIQTGLLADRLRQLLRLSGRIPLRLDEVTVPVVLAGSGTGVPYATDPVHFMQPIESPAVALETSGAGIALRPDTPGSLVVDAILLSNPGSAAALYRVIYDSYARLTDVAIAGLTDFGNVPKVNGLDPLALEANTEQSTGPVELVGTDGGLGVPAGREVLDATVTLESSLIVPGPIVLPPGGAVAVWPNVVNLAVRPTFYGRYFAGVQG